MGTSTDEQTRTADEEAAATYASDLLAPLLWSADQAWPTSKRAKDLTVSPVSVSTCLTDFF